jgi:HemK-related putative methylase
MMSEGRGLFDTAQIGGLRRAFGRARHWHYRLFRSRRQRRPVLEYVADLPIVVLPGVLNPRLMRSGAFFAAALAHCLPASAHVLDLGTGSGVCAVFAAHRGCRVTASDINAEAVRCARLNVVLNGVSEAVEVLHGDLFVPLYARRFDVILFNPPFLQGTPRDEADRAWRATDVAARFAAELAAHLKPGGHALLLLSTFGDAELFLQPLRAAGFGMEVVARRSYINERMAVLRVAQA